MVYIFGDSESTKVVHLLFEVTDCFNAVYPLKPPERITNSPHLHPVFHILPALHLKTSLFVSCVPGGMSFPGLALLISPKVAHFPYKLFYSLLSCCPFHLLVPLSRSALRSLLSRPFPICSYRDHSRLRALTKNHSSSFSDMVRSPFPQEMNLSFHQ